MKLFAPKAFWKLPENERQGRCGPGEGIGEKIVPDHLLFLSITPACSIHDYMFAVGKNYLDFLEANRVFHNNMYRLIDGGWKLLRPARRWLANRYYRAVSGPLGALHYWNDKNKPEQMVDFS